MLSWKDYYDQEQIRQVRLEEAKQYRLVKLVSRQKNPYNRKALAHFLERVGYRLVKLGDSLLRQVADRSLAS